MNESRKEHISKFLKEFRVKSNVFGILFRDDRTKNLDTLLSLELSVKKRTKILFNLKPTDYIQGPIEDKIYQSSDLWVFGYKYNDHELYIKITNGRQGSQTICISFHISEFPLDYPYKQK